MLRVVATALALMLTSPALASQAPEWQVAAERTAEVLDFDPHAYELTPYQILQEGGAEEASGGVKRSPEGVPWDQVMVKAKRNHRLGVALGLLGTGAAFTGGVLFFVASIAMWNGNSALLAGSLTFGIPLLGGGAAAIYTGSGMANAGALKARTAAQWLGGRDVSPMAGGVGWTLFGLSVVPPLAPFTMPLSFVFAALQMHTNKQAYPPLRTVKREPLLQDVRVAVGPGGLGLTGRF